MQLKYHSTVIITQSFEVMKDFYLNVLQQQVTVDFGNCIGLSCGLSLWELQEEYPLSQALGRTHHPDGNKNIEFCFETDEFEAVLNRLGSHELQYLHSEREEPWGQRTIRFFDPERNLIEVGESIASFVHRLHKNGLNPDQISARTSVPISMVLQCLDQTKPTP